MERVIAEHLAEYGEKPEVIVSSPCRVHLMGDHSWFFKDKTLSVAIDKLVYIAISSRHDGALKYFFSQVRERKRGSLNTLKYRKEDRWANAVKAMLYATMSLKKSCEGLNFTIYSELPTSIGLGVTTAIKIASAFALRRYFGMSATNANILETVEKGNREFLEENTYIADINAVLYAKRKHFVLTDNATGTSQLIPFSYTDKTFVITDAKVPRIPVWPEEIIRTEQNFSLLSSLKRQKGDVWEYESSESEINDVLQELNEDMRKRLFYIIKEHYYVNEGVQALREDNFSLFARYVNKSHESLRDLYQLSCPEIDWLIKRAMELSSPSTRTPTVCSRIAGKGFGDCTFAFIPKEVVEKYLQKLTDYERIFGFQPVAYIVKPAGTVKFLKIQEK